MRAKQNADGSWTIQSERDYRAQQGDTARRTLVGARVDRWSAAIYKNAAEKSGRSLYRFVIDALDAEVNRTMGPILCQAAAPVNDP